MLFREGGGRREAVNQQTKTLDFQSAGVPVITVAIALQPIGAALSSEQCEPILNSPPSPLIPA